MTKDLNSVTNSFSTNTSDSVLLPVEITGRRGQSFGHQPVLCNEVLGALAIEAGKVYVDATLGAGGHAEAILQTLTQVAGTSSNPLPIPSLIGVDQDPVALNIAKARLESFSAQIVFVESNYSTLFEHLPDSLKPITGGLLADLGVSSMQLDTGERGFSFSKEAPLDMRMSPSGRLTASAIVNTYPEAGLVRIFSEYGEEHMSKTVARVIVERRKEKPFETTTQLAALVSELYRQHGKVSKIHPATRVFQALRIAVNDEFGHLERFLESLPALMAPGSRVAIITFHSLEDRIVKQFFQRAAQDCICPPRLPICQCNHRATFKLAKGKPVIATETEIASNPRSRSAKLRSATRL